MRSLSRERKAHDALAMHTIIRSPRVSVLTAALSLAVVAGCVSKSGEVTTNAQGQKVICTREKPLGSNIKKKVCRPVDDHYNQQDAQKAIRDAQSASGAGAGGQ